MSGTWTPRSRRVKLGSVDIEAYRTMSFVIQQLKAAIEYEKPLYIATFIDMTKAYDVLPRYGLRDNHARLC